MFLFSFIGDQVWYATANKIIMNTNMFWDSLRKPAVKLDLMIMLLVPTSTTRFASDFGHRMAKKLTGFYKAISLMNNDIKFLNIEWRTWYSLTDVKTILDCVPQLFL